MVKKITKLRSRHGLAPVVKVAEARKRAEKLIKANSELFKRLA